MSVKVKVEPLDQWVSITVDELMSPKARSKAIADFARVRLVEALDANKNATGGDTPYDQFVDGRAGAALETVNPDRGRIVFEFELINEVLMWIMATLIERSPRRSGRYRDSHVFFADGSQAAIAAPPAAEEYSFANLQPYSRKLEIAKTKSGRDFLVSVPNRIYERTAKDARARFGNVAKIGFTYRGYAGGGVVGGRAGNKAKLRYPTITVRPN